MWTLIVSLMAAMLMISPLASAQIALSVEGQNPAAPNPCAGQPAGACVTDEQTAANVPPAFRPLWTGHIQNVDTFMRDVPCERVGLRHSGGLLFIPGSEHEVTFFRDGHATARSRMQFDVWQGYRGRIEWYDYARLCFLASRLGIDRFAALYTANVTDSTGDTIDVVVDDRHIAVVDYAGAAPIEVWGLEQVIEAIRSRIAWTQQP